MPSRRRALAGGNGKDKRSSGLSSRAGLTLRKAAAGGRIEAEVPLKAGADGGNRTRTTLPSRDFKSLASTSSATSARVVSSRLLAFRSTHVLQLFRHVLQTALTPVSNESSGIARRPDYLALAILSVRYSFRSRKSLTVHANGGNFTPFSRKVLGMRSPLGRSMTDDTITPG
jgi:hypothetical protein